MKPNLKDLMSKRNPLSTQREAITPANLYTSIQVDKTTSTQNHKSTSRQVHKPTKPQVVKPTSREVVKTTKPLVEKYTTHLMPETIKKIKKTAFDSECKDYEVVQEALDKYFKNET